MAEEKFNQRKYINKYMAEHYERVNVLFVQGTKEKVTEAAKKLDINISEFIRQAVDEKLSKVN